MFAYLQQVTAMEVTATVGFLMYVIGVVARVIIPYVNEWLSTKEPFNWRFVVGQLIGAFVGILVPTVVVPGFFASMEGSELLVAFGLGWFAADLGREGQKMLAHVTDGGNHVKERQL